MTALLEARQIAVSYGGKQVLHALSLEVGAGEVVGLVGHNGAGKSTALKALFGLVPVDRGEVCFRGAPITGRDASDNVRAGLAFVPQASGVFTDLTVRENLALGGYSLRERRVFEERLDGVHALFPVLRERRAQIAGSLSGGEQQMLALGLALMQAPSVLMLDEPSLGLSPVLIERVLASARAIVDRLGASVLIAEQNVRQLLRVADRIYGLRVGRVVVEGRAADLDDAKLRQLF